MAGAKPRTGRESGERRTLSAEIRLLRDLLQQVQSEVNGGESLKELLAVVDSLGRTSTRIAALLKADQALSVLEEEQQTADRALQDLVERLRAERQEEGRKDG
jgi:nucleotide-binding universal stress UspA family protein